MTAEKGYAVAPLLEDVLSQANRVVLGKQRALRLALSCLLSQGHLLIEDFPGLGKTTLAHTLAQVLGLRFRRVQFTSDLLPSDILGVSIFNRESGVFDYHPGPIFSQVVLADEVNRATPKAQSALLEAMEERQVTVEGVTRPLPDPFFVIATQNPSDQAGTFPLPESQLDRFLMRLTLGYPGPEAERELLRDRDRWARLDQLKAVLTPADLEMIQGMVTRVGVSEALLDYLQGLLDFTRQSAHFQRGLSPRAGLALRAASQAWALLDGRDFVIPEDVQAVLGPVVSHRLGLLEDSTMAPSDVPALLLDAVPVP